MQTTASGRGKPHGKKRTRFGNSVFADILYGRPLDEINMATCNIVVALRIKKQVCVASFCLQNKPIYTPSVFVGRCIYTYTQSDLRCQKQWQTQLCTHNVIC